MDNLFLILILVIVIVENTLQEKNRA